MKLETKSRVILSAVRVLAWRNGLEAFLSVLALLWGISSLLAPPYLALTCAVNAGARNVAPAVIGYVLILTGGCGLIALVTRLRYVRMQSSVVAFIVWGLLAVWSYQEAVPVLNAAAIYSAFAVAELTVYVRILVGFDPSNLSLTDGAVDYLRRTGKSRSEDHAGDS